MCGSALAGNIYCLCTSFRSVSSCAYGSLWWQNQPQSGEDSLFQEFLSGPAPCVRLPVQEWRLWTVALILSPVCCCSTEAEPMGLCCVPKNSRRVWAQSSLPQVGPYQPWYLGGKDSANLFHSPEFAYVSSQS